MAVPSQYARRLHARRVHRAAADPAAAVVAAATVAVAAVTVAAAATGTADLADLAAAIVAAAAGIDVKATRTVTRASPNSIHFQETRLLGRRVFFLARSQPGDNRDPRFGSSRSAQGPRSVSSRREFIAKRALAFRFGRHATPV